MQLTSSCLVSWGAAPRREATYAASGLADATYAMPAAMR
jgi:hypothetical protein